MKRIQIIAIILLALIPLILLVVEKQKFSIKYMICDVNYRDCFIAAKYPSMSSCQSAAEMGSWLCDSLSDPENIDCKPNHTPISMAFCSN